METVSPVAAGETVRVAVRVTPPKEAVMVAVEDAVTVRVVTVKVALLALAATVTRAGPPAPAVLLLATATPAPPDGAAPVKVTVPCEELPPMTLDGLRLSVESVTGAGAAGGETVSVAVLV